ncbi:MAG: class I SAM-dependent methyltransferase [Acidimicrobiales bacterium]
MRAWLPQVVLVAAGMDTRALRLGLPADVVLFEIDRPVLLESRRWMALRRGEGADPRRSASVVMDVLVECIPADVSQPPALG